MEMPCFDAVQAYSSLLRAGAKLLQSPCWVQQQTEGLMCMMWMS
jgi:hypothetical protein